MIQQNYRSSADDESNKERDHADATGKSGGNAGAGRSGGEDLGTEKKVDDERFGSRKPENANDGIDDEGKKDAPGKNDESEKKN